MDGMSRRKVLVAGAGIIPAAGLFGAAAAAQEAARAVMSEDPLLAAMLLIGGRRQIAVSKVAEEGSGNRDVKAFARAEIEEHETVAARLRERGYLFPTVAGAGAAGAVAEGPGGAAPAARALTVGRAPVPAGAAPGLLVQVEVGEQCIANMRAELARQQGLKFDKCYVGDQLHEHFGLLDKAQVFRRHASAELAPVLDEARPIIERHIATLRGLMEALDAMKTGNA